VKGKTARDVEEGKEHSQKKRHVAELEKKNPAQLKKEACCMKLEPTEAIRGGEKILWIPS